MSHSGKNCYSLYIYKKVANLNVGFITFTFHLHVSHWPMGVVSFNADSLEIRLTGTHYPRNLSKVEVRRNSGEWGTMCCSTSFCGTDDRATSSFLQYKLKELCVFLGYEGLLSFSNNLNISQSESQNVYLSLDYYTVGNTAMLYDFSHSKWLQQNCDSSNNLYLSCFSGKLNIILKLFLLPRLLAEL